MSVYDVASDISVESIIRTSSSSIPFVLFDNFDTTSFLSSFNSRTCFRSSLSSFSRARRSFNSRRYPGSFSDSGRDVIASAVDSSEGRGVKGTTREMSKVDDELFVFFGRKGFNLFTILFDLILDGRLWLVRLSGAGVRILAFKPSFLCHFLEIGTLDFIP